MNDHAANFVIDTVVAGTSFAVVFSSFLRDGLNWFLLGGACVLVVLRVAIAIRDLRGKR
jgi:hypothetical protein